MFRGVEQQEISWTSYIRTTTVLFWAVHLAAFGGILYYGWSWKGLVLAICACSIPLQSAYCASKAAIRGFTDSLRSELIHDRSRVAVTMLQLPAVNTPQFDVVRNRLPEHPQPVPPIYQPEVIARAAVHAALHPKREVWIGWSATKAIIGQRLVPGFLDHYLAKRAWKAQETDQLPPGHPLKHDRDNVDHPIPGDRGAHGAFDSRARTMSTKMWARTHGGWLALVGGVLTAALVWWWPPRRLTHVERT